MDPTPESKPPKVYTSDAGYGMTRPWTSTAKSYRRNDPYQGKAQKSKKRRRSRRRWDQANRTEDQKVIDEVERLATGPKPEMMKPSKAIVSKTGRRRQG